MVIIADLHMHSSISDGLDSPEALLARARAKGLSVVSITDHDTLAAYDGARKVAGKLGLELVTGIEISTNYHEGSVHILGYFIDETSPSAQKLVEGNISGRIERMERMLKTMEGLGYKVAMSDLLAFIDGATVGRSALARFMVKSGHFKSAEEAFDKLLGDDRAVFEPVRRFGPQEAIELIAEAGGVSSLAHPGRDITEKDLAIFAEAGLDAVEAITPHHNANQTARWAELAARHGLAVSGGSDCHGPLWRNRDAGAAGLDTAMMEALRAKVKAPSRGLAEAGGK
jgi:hypothetical protein